MEHIIPEMIDPLGRYWEQPKRENIKVVDVFAFMEEKDFKKLASYDTTMPTGVYDGKMFKRQQRDEEGNWLNKWTLVWFSKHEDPDQCTVNYRTIVVLNREVMLKTFPEMVSTL